MRTATDEELLLASGRGDREAFALLVQRQQRTVIQFVHRFLATADRATAEDLAQQVFLSVWRYAPTFQPRAKVLTWLLRITTNACLNYRRYEHSRPSPVRLDDAGDAEQDVRADEVEGRLLGSERAQRVRAAVAGLPPAQRIVVVLRYFHEFSYAEMAAILQTSVSAVDALLHRARRGLYENLSDEKKEESPQISGVRRAQSI